MKVDIKRTIYYLTYIYLLLNFIIYIHPIILNLMDIIYLSITILLLIILYIKNNFKISWFVVFFSLILISFVIFEFSTNSYGCYDILKNTFFAIVAYFIFKDDIFERNYSKHKIDILYILACLYLTYFFILSYLNGSLLSNINSTTNQFYLLTVGDKNWSGLIIFLFFCFCYNRNFKYGSILSIIYTLLLNCRMTQIGLVLFFIVEILKKFKLFNFGFKILEKKSVKNIFFLIIISQISMIAFSYYCTYNIPIQDISNYKESLMDGSNAMRVRANVYAFEEIKSNPMFIIMGYDHKIKEVLGITDIHHSNTYLGFRLVQPHSLLLNLILKYGLIYSIIYLIFISYLISNYCNSNTFACLIVYLFMNMILPFLFSTSYLIFFLFVLYSLTNEKAGMIKI